MEIVTNHADGQVLNTLQPLLGSREELIWVGQPKQGLMLQGSDFWIIPLTLWQGLFLLGIGYFLLTIRDIVGLLVGSILCAITLYLLIGRFFVDAYRRSRIYYALTNRRIIIHIEMFGNNTISYDLPSLSNLCADVKGNGRGTIQVSPEVGWSPGLILGIGTYTHALKMIPNAQQVYELIQDVRG
jgi:hypothetical protein